MKFTSGLPETACGLGSTLRITEHLRTVLPELLFHIKVLSLVDAPCGDCNWISHTNLSGVSYYGIDLNTDHLLVANSKAWDVALQPRKRKLECGDILKMKLPKADAILCREFFQHIPNHAVLDFLHKVRGAGFKWLLATSAQSDNREIGPDMFRPLNLSEAPFHLGNPEFSIPDPPNSGRVLGAWRL